VKLWTKREVIRNLVDRFVTMYGNTLDCRYEEQERSRADVLRELKGLNLDTVSPKEIVRILGNDSWIVPPTCGECGARGVPTVEIGDELDQDSNTAFLCNDCIIRAALLDWPEF
jgi:hypothetical protein